MKKFFNNYFHPFILFIYILFLYLLLQLCRYGRGGLQIEFILFMICGMVLLIWLIICLIRTYQHKSIFHVQWKNYFLIALSIVCMSTIYEGLTIYRLATHLDNHLGFYLHDLRFKKTMSLQNDNLYNNGFLTFMEDFSQQFDVPEQLYLSDSFELKYDKTGKILSFDMFLYGKQEGKTKSYLISYTSGKQVTIYLNNYVTASFSATKDFLPLQEAMKVIPFESITHHFSNQTTEIPDNEQFETFHILYYGQRDWGYNDDGITYIDRYGQQCQYDGHGLIQGYTISIEPLNHTTLIPQRYIYVEDVENRPLITKSLQDQPKNNDDSILEDDDTHIRSKVTQDIYYQLKVTDAAAGSRFYILEKTTDKGNTWQTINDDPFNGDIGVTSGLIFMDENIGFIGMSSASQDANQLYYTHDGGKTFSPIHIQDLEDYDYLSLPYQQNGNYYLKATRAAMNEINDDYQLYISLDQGKTWKKLKD